VQHGKVGFVKKYSGTLLRAVTHGTTHAGPAQCALQDIFSTDKSSLVIIVATEKSMSGLSPSCNWKEEAGCSWLSFVLVSVTEHSRQGLNVPIMHEKFLTPPAVFSCTSTHLPLISISCSATHTTLIWESDLCACIFTYLLQMYDSTAI